MAAKGVEGESRSGEGDLKLRRADGVATIVFDRPTRANALTEEVLAQLADTLETLSRDTETRVLVIRGSGERVFAAGSDLQEINDRTPPVYALDLAAKSGLTQIMRAELPTLAAINGDCIGGGVIIAIAADFRIAVSTARFGIPVGTLGFAYPVEAVERLVHLVGPGHAARLLFTGARIDAHEALRIGLVEQVVEPDAFERVVGETASAILGMSGPSLRASKSAIRAALDDRARSDALRRFDEAWASAEAAERLAAALDQSKRR